MNELSAEHYRHLLEALAAAQAERQRSLTELTTFDADEARRWPYEAEQTLATADREFAEAKLELDDWHARHLAEIDDSYRTDDASVRLSFNRTSGEIDLQADAELASVERKYKDNCWLVQSILDDTSESSPKLQFKRLESQLQKGREQLSAVDDEIRTLSARSTQHVESCWQRVGALPEPSVQSAERQELEQAIANSADTVRTLSSKLQRQILPRLFARWLVLIPMFLLAAGALFAAIYLLIEPAWWGWTKLPKSEWAAIAGGVSVGFCTIMVLVLWNLAARQMSRVFDPLQQQAVDVAAGFQLWQKLADEEYHWAEHDYRTRYVALVERRDRSLAQFAAEYQGRIVELESQRNESQANAAQQRETALRAAMERNQRQRAEENAAYHSALAAIEAGHQQQRIQIQESHARNTTERTAQRQALQNHSDEHWQQALKQLNEAVASGIAARAEHPRDWDHLSAADWQPATTIPQGIRLGDYLCQLPTSPTGLPTELRRLSHVPEFSLPAVLPFPAAPSLVIQAEDAGRREAVAILQTTMLRLLAQLPPGDLRFTIIDPVGLGENFSAFMHLADFDELLITHRIWTEPAQIEEQLSKLTEHMENVFQKYLRHEFASLEEYNQHAGEVAEPYRVLVVADFPTGFTERAAQRLMSIASSGSRCGVITLLSLDRTQSLPRDFDLARLASEATVLEWSTATGGRFINSGIGPATTLIRDELPPTTQFANLIRKLGEASKDVRRVEVPFHRIAPHPEAYWTADSRAGIDVPLGRAGATKLQHLRLGSGTSQHVLIAGKTGSGKSTLLHVVVTDLSLRYSPDEVEFYLIDFKKGVEFKTYAAHRLPHARVIAIESDREFGTSVLERLDTVLKERGDLFREVGAQDIKSYRDARPAARMPRILLIVDEFQEFFVEDDKFSQTAALLLDRLVRQGRAFGIHVLLGSQTLGGAYSLARTTLGQMAVRIALQCSETDAHLILSENNSAARLLTRPGEAIYNDANGLMEGNHPFQVAWLDDEQRDEFLSRLERLTEEQPNRWPTPIVFEGNLPADPRQNSALCALLTSGLQENVAEPVTRIWLGDAVAITGPTEVRFPARTGANLLIVGQDPSAVAGMLTNAVIALAAQSSGRIDRLSDSSDDHWRSVQKLLPGRMNCESTSTRVLAELAAEIARRQEAPAAMPSWFLLISDISRFRELRKSDDDFGFGNFDKQQAVSPGQTFAQILKDGPAVGVHVIVWCDSYNNLDRWFSRQTLREFETRVVFQMAAGDSSNLIDSPLASRLGSNRALVYSDERGTLEKFRPYGPPTESWFEFLQTTGSPSIQDSSDGGSHDVSAPIPQNLNPIVEEPAIKLWPMHPLENRAPMLPLEIPEDAEVPDDLSAWSVK